MLAALSDPIRNSGHSPARAQVVELLLCLLLLLWAVAPPTTKEKNTAQECGISNSASSGPT